MPALRTEVTGTPIALCLLSIGNVECSMMNVELEKLGVARGSDEFRTLHIQNSTFDITKDEAGRAVTINH